MIFFLVILLGLYLVVIDVSKDSLSFSISRIARDLLIVLCDLH